MKDVLEQNWSVSLLMLLILADCSFIGLEIIYYLGYLSDYKFSIGTDRGYAEVYQYVKLFWIVLILAWLALEKRESLYFVGTLLFVYLLLDDSLKLHETIGKALVGLLNIKPALGLRGQDFGELIVSAIAGVFFLASMGLAYLYSSSLVRRIGHYLLAGLVALAMCGVGMDMVHQVLGSRFSWIDLPLILLEDGGELIVVSVICWFVYSAANQELSPLQIQSPI